MIYLIADNQCVGFGAELAFEMFASDIEALGDIARVVDIFGDDSDPTRSDYGFLFSRRRGPLYR